MKDKYKGFHVVTVNKLKVLTKSDIEKFHRMERKYQLHRLARIIL